MVERRPILGLLVGLTICISIWRISVQEPSMLNQEFEYTNHIQYQSEASNKYLIELQQQEPQFQKTTKLPEKYGRPALTGRKNNSTFSSKISFTGSHAPNVSTSIYAQFDVSKKIDNLLLKESLRNFRTASSASGSSSKSISHKMRSLLHHLIDDNALPNDDFGVLIDLVGFSFTINQQPCPRRSKNDQQPITFPPFILILVHSAPVNHKKRLLIRETWGSLKSQHLRLIFLLGAVSINSLQQHIENENKIFSDIVQGNFLDAYKNMTYKHVMAFKWFIYYCPDAELLVKVDDDVFVNTLKFLEYIDVPTASLSTTIPSLFSSSSSPPIQKQSVVMSPLTPRTYHVPSSSSSSRSISGSVSSIISSKHEYSKLTSAPKKNFKQISLIPYYRYPSHNRTVRFRDSRNLLFCDEQIGSRIKRSYRSKWRVSVREYAGRYYPPYCPGFSIAYSPDIVFRLYRKAQNSKYFWIDDVHVTGTLAHQANISITSSRSYILDKDTCELILSSKTDMEALEFLFAWPGISEEQIRDLWALNVQHFFDRAPTSYGGDNDANKYVFR